MRLLPLLEVEEILTRRLATLEDAPSTPRPQTLSTIFRRRPGNEVAVNSTVPWKSAFMRDTSGRESFATEDAVDWEDPEDPGIVLYERAEDMRHLWEHPTVRAVLERQRIRLQESPGLCVTLAACFGGKCCTDCHCPSSFLDELDVVTSQRYVPTDGMPGSWPSTDVLIILDHILRARLKTLVSYLFCDEKPRLICSGCRGAPPTAHRSQ
jgi:guanine nucleotide-binding protein subunit alpha